MESSNGKKPISDPKPAAPKADTLARQLKDSLAKRRPRPWLPVLAILTGSVLILVFLAYWYYPRPPLTPLQIMALDVVGTTDEVPQVRAQLLTPLEEKTPRPLNGFGIIFHRPLTQKANDKPIEIVTKSDARGQAAADWPKPSTATADFSVNHVDPANRHVDSDLGRIFIWPKDAPILIVDAAETLGAEEVDEQASATLRRAAKEDWHIVYVALGSEQPQEFRAARIWIARNQAKLPIGPVLGRPHIAEEESAAQARRAILQSLKERFQGPMVAVVKNEVSAQISKDAGVRTIMIGAGAAPAGVTQAPTWSDVVVRVE
ncbi:MAG: hypothetical protein EXR98_01175 [Gemmataceae bacterium]|nr:hypothetical protein [Gemmataceae bacterium]